MNAESCQNYQNGAVRNQMTTLEGVVNGERGTLDLLMLHRAEPVFVSISGSQESIQPGWELISGLMKWSTNMGSGGCTVAVFKPYTGYNLTLSLVDS